MTDRDQALDVFKGLLVACMVYCHVLQFFGDATLFPAVGALETLINLTVFPGFVFAFGCALSLAYLPKPFARVWPRMLRAAIKPLGAFYLSGIAFRVLRENKPFAADTVRRVLLLQDIPGWSEFLLAFSLYGLLAMILFRPLRSLRGRPLVAAGLSALCLAACFLPYGRIRGSYAGLLIGTRDMVTFPVLQYAPYFLMGLVFPECGRRYARQWALGAAACAALGAAIAWLSGGIPERFPPSLGWVLL
ncbi:MAG TPA: hypothetical protein PKE04_06025, partial [Clostridia bacterium]|nr:hypothetical protein [Clostridia bacterium]